MAYLALDVGTSGCKVAVFAEDGRVLATARHGYALLCPRPGYAELDPEEVWRAVCEALREIAPAAAGARAMAISSLGESFVLLDADDRPLSNSMTYLDRRGREELAEIEAVIDGGSLYRSTGTQVSEMYSLPKWLWLRKHRPEAIKRAEKLLLFGDFIGYRLTGQRVIDPSLASRTMLLDVRALDWHRPLLDAFEMKRELLSDVRPAGTPVGNLLPGIARELGLPEEMALYAGCHDQCAATLGAGVWESGGVMAGMGTSESVIVLAERAKVLPPPPELLPLQLSFEPFIDTALCALTLGQPSYGTCLQWFAQSMEPELSARCAEEGKSVFEALDAACAGDAQGVVFLPYLAGVHPLFPGMRAEGAFLGLSLATEKPVLYRALLEGLCFETRIHCELLKALRLSPTQIMATGGCTRSALHMKMKADALRLPVCTLDTPDAGLTGLAMLCAVAIGDISGYAEAARRFVHIRRRCEPSGDCEAGFQRYRSLRDAVVAAYAGLR